MYAVSAFCRVLQIISSACFCGPGVARGPEGRGKNKPSYYQYLYMAASQPISFCAVTIEGLQRHRRRSSIHLPPYSNQGEYSPAVRRMYIPSSRENSKSWMRRQNKGSRCSLPVDRLIVFVFSGDFCFPALLPLYRPSAHVMVACVLPSPPYFF